jgi:hypothetical protein
MAQFKVTCDSGKVVVLRELTVKIKNQAMEAASGRATTTTHSLGFSGLMMDEILKHLIVSVDGKAPSPVEREDLDSFLTYSEYQALTQVMQEMMGGTEAAKKPKIEMVITSS